MDTATFDAQQESLFSDLRRICYGLGAGDAADAIAGEVVAAGRERLARLEDESVPAVLRRVAVKATRQWRRRKSGVTFNGSYRPDATAFEGLDLAIHQRAAFCALSIRQREIVALVYVSGFRQDEVADMLSVSAASVARTLWEARCRLAEELAAYRMELR
jgi:DNA-directed RNA polymerase specialized sigma24 family protein